MFNDEYYFGPEPQPLDGELTALAGLVSAADKVPYFTGFETAALADFSAYGRTLIDDANANVARGTLGLGDMAVQNKAAVNIDGGAIDGVTIGTNSPCTELQVDDLNFNGRVITNSSVVGMSILSDAGLVIDFSAAAGPGTLAIDGTYGFIYLGDFGIDAVDENAGDATDFNVDLLTGGNVTSGTGEGGKGGGGTFTSGIGGNALGVAIVGSGGNWRFICQGKGTGGLGGGADGRFIVITEGDGGIDFTGPLNVSGDLDVDGTTTLVGASLSGALFVSDTVSLTTNFDNNAPVRIFGEAEAGGSRGGVLEWYHNNATIAGFTFGQGTKFVWKDSASGASDDTGNAWVDFVSGDAGFGLLTSHTGTNTKWETLAEVSITFQGSGVATILPVLSPTFEVVGNPITGIGIINGTLFVKDVSDARGGILDIMAGDDNADSKYDFGQLRWNDGDNRFEITTAALVGGDILIQPAGDLLINSITKLGDGGSSHYTQFSATGSIGFFGSAEVETDMPFKDAVFPIIDKASGNGIKIDTATPTFSFRDLIGDIKTRPAAGGGAAAQPDFVAYRGNIYGYRFGTNAPNDHIHEAFIEYHVPHDYVPGTDIHMHVHWSQVTVDDIGGGVPGVAEWFFDITYADGYGTAGGAGDPFVAPKTISVTQQGSTTQYGHMIAEVVITGATDTATTFDRDTIEVDGLFLLRVYRTPGAGNDTLIEDTFVHFGDMHYQTTNIGTKDKNAPFYT